MTGTMNFTTITDLNIPELQIYRHLRDNAVTEDNSFIADSPKVVNMLLKTSIEVHSTPQLINWTEFGKELPIEGIEHESEGRFVVYNHVTGTRRSFTSWNDAAGCRAEMAQRYAMLERAFR